MERIVSTPDLESLSRGQRYGQVSGPVVADPSHQLVAEQTRILDADLAAFLAEEPTPTPKRASKLLPGFEVLTEADLRTCPAWCIHQDLPVHSDGFDADPDEAPHTSVQHTIRAIHGGEGIDHAGSAEVSVQLEQDRHLTSGSTVTLSVAVQGIEQYAWLTIPEARAVQQALTHLLTETDN